MSIVPGVSHDGEYVLGTDDEEIARLALQHRVWSERAREAWEMAHFAPGQHVLDVGCGPGFAALDLARLVGPAGHVTAIDESARFLQHLQDRARAEHLGNIATVQADLDALPFAAVRVDGVWARWVFAFVREPRSLLARIAARMPIGASFAIHEYFNYTSWRTAPPSPELDEFVRAVIDRWRRSGGEPDIALMLPHWLEEAGFEIMQAKPLIDIVTSSDPQWAWLTAFIESGRKRLVALGDLSPDRAEQIAAAMHEWAFQRPAIRMVTPAVMQIIAVRARDTA